MDATQPPLAELLKITEHWVEFDTEHLVATSLFGDRNIPRYKVMMRELATMHPDLPATLNTLFSWLSKNKNQFHINAKQVSDNARLLNGQVLAFEDEDGEPRYFERVEMLKSFTYFKEDSLMRIRGRELATENINGTRFVVGFDNSLKTVSVSKSAMDIQYPGWESRWKIGLELGVDNEQLLDHVFSVSQRPPTSLALGNINFDHDAH